MPRHRRRRRKLPPFQFDPATLPPYKPGYLESRYREYQAYDQLPNWARGALKRTKREWQAIELLNRLKDGDNPLDIIADLERCERIYSEQHFEDHDLTLNKGETPLWRIQKPGT